MIYSLSEKEQRRSYYHSTSAKNTPTLKSILKSILSTQKKELLDSMIYKDTNNKLCLTIYRKPTDRQNYFYFKSANPSSPSTSHSNICNETNEVTKHLPELKEAFLKRGYQEILINHKVNRLNH